MKAGILSIGLAISMIATGADNPAHRVEIKSIAAQVRQTPRLQVEGAKAKPIPPRSWIEIEAEIKLDGPDKDDLIPELRTKWYAIVMDRSHVDANGKQTVNPKMLTGEVVFENVRAKEKRAYLVAYIAPDDLEKLTGKDRPGEGDVEAAALVISGKGILADPKHAPGLQKATAKQELKWWEGEKYPTMEGLIVPKSKTPFAPLWCDRYPSEKEK
jgi:hypothetical protein